jgi:D-alanyl-lipoteichoic acid acyltransferase DltB (MBOAT superfamily)
MVFNSWVFALFLVIVLALYYLLRLRGQNLMLLAASLFFYGWWDWRFLGLLLLSTVIDYAAALGMQHYDTRPRLRRLLMLASLVSNLGILAFFKYFNFFTESAVRMLDAIGIPYTPATLQIILPVGISFYTFQTLSYTIDVYRRQLQPTRDPLLFALYVSYFPQLVAGPIERASTLLPALAAPRRVTEQHLASGVGLILVGLVKKIAVADFLAGFVTAAFTSPDAHSSIRLLIAAWAFALQIYGDFSGYSDIARGASRLMGIELMVNFRQPCFAVNITDFWRRWHISLSTWLRDYLYIPLGGSRQGTLRTYANLMTTMLLGGLWHGASWTFVIWGGLHGLYLCAHKLFVQLTHRSERKPAALPVFLRPIVTLASIILTFNLVCLTWVFFRAASLGAAVDYLAGIVSFRGPIADPLALIDLHRLLIAGGVILLIDLPKACVEHRGKTFITLPLLVRGAFAGLMLCALLVLGDRVNVPFIYFQF